MAQEVVMGKINWGRVFLCGIVTAGVYVVLTLPIFLPPLRETDFVAALVAAGRVVTPLSGILTFAIGIWTIWLYAAIRPRYGPGPKTAAVAGFAVWLLGSWADAVWEIGRASCRERV